jgi:hypothetical protein
MPDPPGTQWLREARQRPQPPKNWTPQELFLYNHHIQNLARGGARNPQGGISTILNITAQFGKRHYVLPTIWDNQFLTADQAIERAKQVGLDKFPSYKSEKEANSRYEQLHTFMEKDMEFQ